MRQIQGFTNKVAVPSFTRDAAWHTVDLSGILDADAKFVEVEIVLGAATIPPNVFIGLRPTGTNLGDDVWRGAFLFPAYTTLTMRVNALGEVDFNCNHPEGDVDFFITGEWGGDAVVDLGADYPQATGWTTGNSGTYREFDLTSLIPVEDRGNVEAVLFYARGIDIQVDRHESADARANGSTIDDITAIADFRQTRIAKVDDGDLIEVREDADYTKGVPGDQNSFVHFAGYVKRGAFDDGTGLFYSFNGIVDGSHDGVDAGTWTAYDVRPKTAPAVAAIYWRLKTLLQDSQFDYYCREIGSTDAAEGINRVYQAMRLLDVDASFEVEHFLTVGEFRGTRIYGWIVLEPPEQATDPVPAHLATGVPTDQILGWTAGAGAISHDVFFGTDADPSANFIGNQPGTTYNPGTLIPGTTYFWRIDELNLAGTTTGIVWSFTVGAVCIAATPSAFARVSAVTSTPERVSAATSTAARVSAVTLTPNRVSATPRASRRISAIATICGEGGNMRANTTCPDELPWNATAVLDLDEVLDDLTDPGTAITSGTATCSIFDAETGVENAVISPVTLAQVASTNQWRKPIDITAANGFTRKQRLRLVYHFDGGALLLGEFEALGVVVAAVN